MKKELREQTKSRRKNRGSQSNPLNLSFCRGELVCSEELKEFEGKMKDNRRMGRKGR